MAGPSRDDHSYRRGLVLGWSLAEIFLLIVFALLFAFAAKVGRTQSPNPANKPPNGNKSAPPAPTAHPTDDFDATFRKLTLCEERLKACNEDEKKLKPKIKELEPEIEKLKAENEQLKKELAQLKQKAQVMTQPGHNGVDYDSCFKNSAGKTEYIFNVTLTDSGIIVHKNDLPDQRDKEAALPLNQITFDRELSDTAFIDQTRGIFEYSEQQNCRFVVTVLDQTGPDEKETYKERLRTVTGPFYQHPVKTPLSASSPDSDD